MINSNDGAMELKIDESISLPSSLKSHQHYHESSGYSSKEAECSSPENKAHGQHRNHESRSRIASNNNNNHGQKPADIHRRRHKLPTSSFAISGCDFPSIDETSSDLTKMEKTVSNEWSKFFLD